MVGKADGKKDLSLFQGFNKPIPLYSAMATVDDMFLLNRVPPPSFADEVKRRFQVNRITFERTSSQGFKDLVPLYSTIVTVDDTFLLKRVPPTIADEIKRRFGQKRIAFERTIGTDERLAHTLVQELRNRKIDVHDKDTHIVLVTEFDTSYGRSFQENFMYLLRNEAPLNNLHNQVHLISYLRGIDGSVPGEKDEKKDEKADAKSDPLKDVKKLEQPVGKSQYDYLRRLAEEIYRMDQDLLYLKNGKGGIKAIGVLGTDFYDKYLVLQALRQRLPDAVYFTTDLDARMLHPDHIQWTRNLVVASNFGLSLRKDEEIDIQGQVPPFRDNYQTSVFLTVLRAFPEHLTPEPAELPAFQDRSISKPMVSWAFQDHLTSEPTAPECCSEFDQSIYEKYATPAL